MTPITYYHQQCQAGLIQEDPEQLRALKELERIQRGLIKEQRSRRKKLAFLRKPKLIHGLYLWGGVGIGKTFMMDCFFHTLPFTEKKRMHFHQFMHWIQQELKQYQGQKNPIELIVQKLARDTMVLCFDEFFVKDIADAMILARLLDGLFAAGVTLVTTSNTVPDELYKRGLQRQQFLPAIALLKQHTHVMHIPTLVDYRVRHLRHAGVFYRTQDEAEHENMEKSFTILAEDNAIIEDEVEICDRKIPIRKRAGNIIWFEFDVLCNVPRSQHDYLAIADQYETVFLSNIPQLSANARNTISLFIRLVDVFYDKRVRLVFSAAVPVEEIYTSGELVRDYQRTCSRLQEMQSEDYFSKKL